MSPEIERWTRVILDADPAVKDLGCLAVADLDGDGHAEMVVGGNGGLFWYRPGTCERGTIAQGHFVVGLALQDLDGDGRLEVVVGQEWADPSAFAIVWFKHPGDLSGAWSRHVIDPAPNGSTHDLVFCDVDGDGRLELIANAAYCAVPGIFIYALPTDLTSPWHRHTVATGFFSEGLSVADLDGDGRIEIIHGPDWYRAPAAGPFAGPWQRNVYAPSFREMCRTASLDVTRNGCPDIVIVESEYPDGRLAWFENRLAEDPGQPWVEHMLGTGWSFAHSLGGRAGPTSGETRVFVAEMAAGCWNQPYNYDARLAEFVTRDGGGTWQIEPVDRGMGTHQALMADVDGDGTDEVAGKEWGLRYHMPRVQLWDRRAGPDWAARARHRLLDRDKPYTATDILAADVDGDGRQDVVCGAWWYHNPTWERFDIPGIYQVHSACDLDGDGRVELIATKRAPDASPERWYSGLSSQLCWLRPVDPAGGVWDEHPIGTGAGDWPHATLVAPLLPGGRLALVVGYHGAEEHGDLPQLFEVPADLSQYPWPARTLADIPYGEEFVACDLTGDGALDLVAGRWWLENLGDGTFLPRQVVLEGFTNVARVRVADVNGSGRLDIVVTEEALDYAETRQAFFAPIAWFENPGDPRAVPWPVHVIDKLRSPHSLDVADIDGDGQPEIIAGEHDPFSPYRSRSRLCIYTKADPAGCAWIQHVLDDRFEHHDGTKLIELSPGRMGIVSHGWVDSRYVHLWELVTPAPQSPPSTP